MHEANTTHGRSKSAVYSVWSGMKSRCIDESNVAFGYYGGRGIKVCERWLTFENFLADMGEPPPRGTLDRLDNDGDYAPGNCAWRSRLAQQNNRRVNRLLEVAGEKLTRAEAARKFGIHYNTLCKRLDAGLPPSDAIDPHHRKPDQSFALCAAKASSQARKARTHCAKGHEWTPENTAIQGTGRLCRTCRATWLLARKASTPEA